MLSNSDEQLSPREQAESQWLLNEFNALRQEFLERFRSENLLVLAALTFLGTIIGVAFKDANPTSRHILLAIPVMMPLIGVFYLNQRLSNTAIGLYVKDQLRERVNNLLKSRVLNWEEYVRSNTSLVKELTVFLFIFFVFAGPSCAVLVTLVPWHISYGFEQVAWWFGAVLTLVWSVLWVSQFSGWFGTKK